MQQKEGSSFWVSCQGLPTSEENTPLQFHYTQHDNESLEYDNNQETEYDSDSNACQKMNSLESDGERNMFMAFSKGSLTEKKEALLLGSINPIQITANSGDSEAQKPSQLSTPSQPAVSKLQHVTYPQLVIPSQPPTSSQTTMPVPSEDSGEDSSFLDYNSTPDDMYPMRKLQSVCGFSNYFKGAIVLSLVVGLLFTIHQPPIVHPHNHKNATSGVSSNDMKGSTDKATDDTTTDGSMTRFCLPSQELSSQCHHEELSIQQCVVKEFDDTFWTPFKVADESMCSVEGGVHYGPEAPFRDPAPGYDIPRYKERTHSSFFGSIHALPMEKISLSVPKLKRKRKKKSQSRSKQRTSMATTVEVSTSEPVPGKDSHGTRVIVVLFQLLLLQCTVLPVSSPLQEHLLLSYEAQTGLANYATFTDYQDIEILTISHVVITGIILLLNAFRQSIVMVWPDVRRGMANGFHWLRCALNRYLPKTLRFLYGLFIKLLICCWKLTKEQLYKKLLERLLYSSLHHIREKLFEPFGKLEGWMQNQLAKFGATQSHNAKPKQSKPSPADLQPQPLVSQINDQPICQQQAKDRAEKQLRTTCSDHTASGTNKHQVTAISSQVTCTGGFVNSAEYPLEDASQIEIADDFSKHINHTSLSVADNDAGSLPYREHTDRVEPPSPYDSAALPHGSFGMEKENSQYVTTSPSMGIHLEAKPCEPIACSDSSNGGQLVCPTFYRRRDGNIFQNEEFVCPSQGGVLLNDLNSTTPHDHNVESDELTAIMPQEVTAAIPMDSPNKLYMFGTAVNYDLIKLQCVRMANEGLLPPERHLVHADCSMPLHESLGHNATLYTFVLSEADREAIQLQGTPCLVCICQQ